MSLDVATLHDLGIVPTYTDLQGQTHHANDDTLNALVAYLSPSQDGYQSAWVGQENQSLSLKWLSTTAQLSDEHGTILQSALPVNDGMLTLPPLPLGYYTISDGAQSALVVIAPEKTHQPPRQPQTGLTLQLYALRHKSPYGIGDFAALANTCYAAAKHGMDFVGINPLHALFTQNPNHASPYSPNSRLFLNPIYLSLDWLPHPPPASRRKKLATAELLDYHAIWHAKLPALYQSFKQSQDDIGFLEFCTQADKALWYFAVYEALSHHFRRSDWTQWQRDYHDPNSPAVRAFAKQHTDDIRFYQWLQWQCHVQLNRVREQSALSLGLYGDLAVGAARGSFDVWYQQSAYCLPASMGAPPDHLAPQGQNWQLPPFHPKALLAQGFAPFIALLRANMRQFGILRIDHVIGLSRLWWALDSGGAYVRYRDDVLFAIVALESVRARCVVIGEDLGIVPDETRHYLEKYGIYSYNVLYFSKQDQQFTPPEQHPHRAITVTSTHDVAPLCGYWHASDLHALHGLNVLSDDAYQSALHERQADKALWARQLGLNQPSDLDLIQAFHEVSARSQSALVAVQIENLLGERQSVNLPGVAEAYPNWRVRYTRELNSDDWTSLSQLAKARQAQRPAAQSPILTLSDDDHAKLKALCMANLHDPFAYLGRHHYDEAFDIVRVFIPTAQRLTLTTPDGHPLAEAKRFEHEGNGLFLAFIPKTTPDYRYRIDAESALHTDAYALPSTLREMDLWLLGEGKHQRPYQILGAHPMMWVEHDGSLQLMPVLGVEDDDLTWQSVAGVRFCVWAPNAARVSVVGDFNGWDGRRHPMRFHAQVGIWEIFIPESLQSALYKFEIRDQHGHVFLKADPYAFAAELRPNTSSIVRGLPKPYRAPEQRAAANALNAPMSIYEVHLGSWRRKENGDWLSYRELAETLIPYAKKMGFTHLELLPISEFPFDGSWGYQPTALYSPTKRFGSPADLQYFVQTAHQAGLGVILDWVVGHFPTDAHGLAKFDGSALYEHQDPREGYHQDWNTLIYNFGRHEVKNFLAGNALYWLEYFGFDGLRVDAVASMIYRDYSRKDGEWVANQYGGRENLEAIAFLKHTNELVRQEIPHAIMMAEESTAFPHVTSDQGLHFHYKWNMGWMNDTLRYMKEDPINRKYHHHLMTFGMVYQYSENFILPLSHDEVVHGKASLLGKMPGDCWQQFANLRAYYGFMFAYPGKKLLFMGAEFAQGLEWNSESALAWHLLDEVGGWHQTMHDYVRTLNALYQRYPAFYQQDNQTDGFEWLVVDDGNRSIYAFERRDVRGNRLIALVNFTPVQRENYRLPVKQAGAYQLLLNGDQSAFHGSGIEVAEVLHSEEDERGAFVSLNVPPLTCLYLYQSALAPEQPKPTAPKPSQHKAKA